jgi:hypothetical protein
MTRSLRDFYNSSSSMFGTPLKALGKRVATRRGLRPC